jgi:hypothetical protein
VLGLPSLLGADDVVDVASLPLAERKSCEQATPFAGIVVLDCRLEVLPNARRLAELAAEQRGGTR